MAAGPSLTAQRVAAHRLHMPRQPAPFGDPEADLRLAADVAAGIMTSPSGPMRRYLEARTNFFDRVLLNALERGVSQVVAVGAGYDGRSMRYAKAGVRWFEVDHPGTQEDKRARLARLGLTTPDVTYVGADFRVGGLGRGLLASGFDAGTPCIALCEGVAVYLEREVLGALLNELRDVAAYGSRLAASFSVSTGDPWHEAHRQRFHEDVAALGEPALTVLGPDEARAVLEATGWALHPLSERARHAGFVVAEAAYVPRKASPEGASPLEAAMVFLAPRTALSALPRHLEETYGVDVDSVTELDLGVLRVDRSDGPSWVARVFPAARGVAGVEADAAVLAYLEAHDFPAERLARPASVSVLEGQPVLVTKFSPGERLAPDEAGFRLLGDMLGRLHRLPGDGRRPPHAGGGWHHLVGSGGVGDELAAALSLVEETKKRAPAEDVPIFEAFSDELGRCRLPTGLPEALVHPDLVAPNVVGHAPPVIVDWAGAGTGPRVASLGWSLWAAGAQGRPCLDGAVAGYAAHVQLEPEELESLPAAVHFRRVVLQVWSVCVGRKRARPVADSLPTERAHAEAVAERTRQLLGHR